MNKTLIVCQIIAIFFIAVLLSCSTSYKSINYNEVLNDSNALEIHEGLICQSAQRINYKKGDKTVAIIKLSQPIKVAQSEEEEAWGYFQFPVISKTSDGTISVFWSMKEDSDKAYGKNTKKGYVPMMSKDKGKHWIPYIEKGFTYHRGNIVFMKSGATLGVNTPAAKDIRIYENFPQPVLKRGRYAYYIMDSLPDDLKGVYFNYWDSNHLYSLKHSNIKDPGLLREAVDSYMPIYWMGDIKQLNKNILVAGVYPTFYKSSTGEVMPSAVAFYRSVDCGDNWERISTIPVPSDGIANVRGDNRFDEPTFEVLKDGTFICVIRSGNASPMYETFSYDQGLSWTTPKPFTPNGVKPSLMLLDNGVLVLTSGRPGVQLRFSLDGAGNEWTDPIDMIPFMNIDGTYDRNVSCGYAGIIEDDDKSFYLVYSDFTTKNDKGENRKSIWCRRVTVERKDY